MKDTTLKTLFGRLPLQDLLRHPRIGGVSFTRHTDDPPQTRAIDEVKLLVHHLTQSYLSEYDCWLKRREAAFLSWYQGMYPGTSVEEQALVLGQYRIDRAMVQQHLLTPRITSALYPPGGQWPLYVEEMMARPAREEGRPNWYILMSLIAMQQEREVYG
jgi:hypothetical protein